MRIKPRISEFVLDSSANNKQGTLGVFLSSISNELESQQALEYCAKQGRKVHIVNCHKQQKLLPDFFEGLSSTQIADWLTESLVARQSSQTFRETIFQHLEIMIKGLNLLGKKVSFSSIAKIVENQRELTYFLNDLDRDHHDVAALSEEQKRTFHEIMAFQNNSSRSLSKFRSALLPMLSYLSWDKHPFGDDESLSWLDIMDGGTLLFIEFDFMNHTGEAKLLYKIISERMLIHPGLIGIC